MIDVLCIVQARCSSTRLPNKVLKELDGYPMFVYQAKRIIDSKKINKLVVATSRSTSDDLIEEACKDFQLECFRGSLDNVLSRFYYAAKEYCADLVVRLTADCPLIDPMIIDQCIEIMQGGDFDYVSNCQQRTYADGMDIEVFTFKVLEAVYKNASLISEQEHVTPYIWKNPDLFTLGAILDNEDQSSLRLTVDYEEDFKLISHVVEHFNNINKKNFSYEDIKRYILDNPNIKTINNQYSCNEGYAKSLKDDEVVN